MVKAKQVKATIYYTTKVLTDYGMNCSFEAIRKLFEAARQSGRLEGMLREALKHEETEEIKELFEEAKKLYNNTWAVIELTLEKCKVEGIK